ncbi:MAG: mechanosensitive ion channel domain-containing protein [Myxococcota bacterium]
MREFGHHWVRVGAVVTGLLAALAIAPSAGHAQSVTPEEPSPLDVVKTEIAETKASLEDWRRKAAEYAQASARAPSRTEELEREIETFEAGKAVEVPEGATVDELDDTLEAAETDLSEARRHLLAVEEEISQRADRRRALPDLLEGAKQRLTEWEASPPLSSENAELDNARQELRPLRVEALQAEIAAYEAERESYETRGRLLGQERDLTVLEIAYLEELTVALRAALKNQQQEAVEAAIDEARTLLDSLSAAPKEVQELVTQVVEENRQLADRWTGEAGVANRITDVSEKLMRAEAQINDIDGALRNLRQQIAAVGLVDSVGLMLRRQREEAPDVGMYRRFIRMRQPEIGQVQLAQIQLRERRQQLSDIEGKVSKVMEEASASLPEAKRPEVQRALRELLDTQRGYLDELIDDYETYFEKLVDFDARQRELIERTEKLTNFIDARVLWVPSGRPIGSATLTDGKDGAAWLMSPRYRRQLVVASKDVYERDLWWILLFAVTALLMLIATPRIRKRIDALGEQVRGHTTRFSPTATAVGLSMLLVPWLPLLLMVFGWRLERSPEATHYVRSIAYGIVAAGAFWLSLRFVAEMLRSGGVAEAHARFPKACVASLRRALLWFGFVTIPAVFIMFVFEAHGEDPWSESIGRLAFIASMIVAAAFTGLAVRPGGPVVSLYKLDQLPPNRRRWWLVARVAAVLVPLALLGAAIGGYYWTALQLAFRYHLTLLFLFSAQLIFNLSMQWALVARRRVAREQMKPRADDEEEDEKVDLVSVEAQTRRLIRGSVLLVAAVGVLLVWAEILPAVGILQHVELWNTTQTVTLSVEDAAGIARETSETRLVPVTLADLFGAFLIGMIALALVRNLPGLLEVSVFRRFTAGERYAYSTLIKYAIAIAGIAMAMSTIGIGWSSIQWLVAAVGVGLGFGLQEIFANFISGLIILFERPIRVGDTVTVGQISGTVTKIRTRATWITGFDRRELVVPNKEFVTQQLINWSLSDSVLRVEIEVGIAYGSDTEKAVEVLERVAVEHPAVMSDPPPQVLFLGFGDSSLSFELRVFLPDARDFIQSKHELHMAVDAAFREAEIEIAFPQRDLHVRSLPAKLQPAEDAD